jgi:hypothetical protein
LASLESIVIRAIQANNTGKGLDNKRLTHLAQLPGGVCVLLLDAPVVPTTSVPAAASYLNWIPAV